MRQYIRGTLKKIFNGNNDPEKRSVISRRFIIAISVIYSCLIIATSVSFNIIMARNTGILKDALASNSRDLFIGKIDALVERLKSKRAATSEDIKKELREYNAAAGDYIGVIIFTKTADENFFRIADTLIFHEDLNLAITKSEVVREQKDINYLKMGILHSAMDPDIYSQSGYVWQNVYYPYEVKNKKSVIQFLVSAARLQTTIDAYTASTGDVRTAMISITAILVLAVVILTIVFLQNYSLLIRNLSDFMKKAADGNLDVSLNETRDDELNQLALSFNTLIDELKDKTVKTLQEPETNTDQAHGESAPGQDEKTEGDTGQAPAEEMDGIGPIFATGVSMLKENRLDEAIAIFLTLTIMKPGGFGSVFNLGVAYAKNREYEKAIRMFEEAGRINPTFEVTSQYVDKIKKLLNADD